MARRRRFLAAALSAAMVLTAVGAYLPAAETVTADDGSSEDANLVDSLVGYYTFDETLENSASTSGGTASLHGGAGDTWNEDATGTASYSSDAVSGSAYEFSGNSNIEILTSSAWWSGTGVGTGYALADGESMTFTVECTADVDDYAAFSVELYDASGNYLTTGSDGNAWFAGSVLTDGNSISGILGTIASTVVSGETYTITVSRSSGVYTVTYYDTTNDTTFATLVGTTSTTDFDDTVYVHIISQVGTFQATNESVTATSGEGLELDVTTSANFTISGWVYTEQKIDYQSIFFLAASTSDYLNCGTIFNSCWGGVLTMLGGWSGEVLWVDNSSYDIQLEEWTYLTVTVSSDGEICYYFNGTLAASGTYSTYNNEFSGVDLFLGINYWNESFCGLMDEVTVYSSALTADEVYTLYSYDGNPTDAAEAEESGELATSISHVSVHDPSIVKGYVASSVTELTEDTEIVGVADDTHTKGIYFIFGSHLAFAYSWDLMNWTTFTNNITTDYETLFASEATWSANGTSDDYDLSGNMWAPDVIWNTSMNCWCMYMSINGDNWYSTICMLTSDSLYGDWEYVDMVIQSGNYAYASTGATFDYYTATGETSESNNLDRYTANRNGNLTYEDNCIDPCVLYDEAGNLWMTYGSWFGGIWMIKLDATTGLRDYDTTYEYVENETDPYQGYKLAGGFHSSGEASYIEYYNGYYYLFVTYGGLTAAGGYNMRVYRSDSITGPYTDESGDAASYTAYTNNYVTGSGLNSTLGMRLMSQYKWSYQTYAQVAQGHNSVYYDKDTDQIYLVYHTRTNDGTEGHSVRVHQLFQNEDGWLVTAPFEYAGESTTNADITGTSYSATEIAGSYEIIVQATAVDYANLEYVEPEYITLGSDGTISGDYTGTWTTTDETCYIQLTMGSETYNGVLLTETMEGKAKTTITFTAVGTTTEVAVWGYQYSGTDAIEMEAEALTLPAQTVNGTALDLITTGTYGTTITWASSDESIIATDGTVTVPTTDTTVTLTATISNSDGSGTYTYDVKVIGSNSIDEDGNITVWTSSDTYDLTDAVQGTYSFANYFNATVGTAGLTLYNGVSIEFTAERTGDYNYLSNILGFNVDGDNSANIMYFTGGSYLGFNATSGYFDANADTTNWVTGTDYIGSDGAVTIKIVILPSTYEVYVDGELAYSMDTVASGETSGTNGTIDTIYSVLTYLNSTATEMDLGWGSWWEGGFAGTISNITLIALAEDAVDTCGYAYYANYSNAGGELSDWVSTNDSSALGISNDGDSYGNYLEFAVNTGTNSRGAYTTALSDAGVSSNYTVEADIQLTNGSNQISEFAIMTSGYAWTSSSVNEGIASGYILKLQATAAGATTYYVNDGTDTVTIPAATWVHISVYVAEDGETVTATISYDGATDQTVTTAVNGSSELAGMYVRRGRYNGRFCVDNIKVYETPTITFLGGSLWMDTDDYTTTALRFGYTIDLGSVGMEGVVASGEEDADQPTWSWTWSVDGETYGGTLDGENYIDNGDGTITTNLVITDIPSSYYSTDMYSTLTFTYCLGGTTITITDDMQTRSVEQVATAIKSNSTDSSEVAYAEQILALISE